MHIAFQLVDIVTATLIIQLSNLVVLLLDELTYVVLFSLSLFEIVIVATVWSTLPPHESSNNLARPELFLRSIQIATRRVTLSLHATAFQDSAKVIGSAVLVLEHRESHPKKFVNNLAVLQHVVQVLDHGDGNLLVTSFYVIEDLDLARMVGLEVMLALTPLSSRSLQPLPPLSSLASLAALTILVRQSREIVRVTKADGHLLSII